jgi:uncharacterized protein involved in outer membrane biogenesis
MSKFIKIFFWLTGIFVLFLLAAIYLTPRLINSELLKGKIEDIASEKIGGSVDFEKIDLSVLPRPHAIIHKGAVSNEAASGTIKSLSIYPKILPLFKGEFQITRFLVKYPDFEIDFPEDNMKSKKQEPVSYEAITRNLSTFMAPLALSAPDLVVVLEGGRFNLVRENKTAFLFEDMFLRMVFPPAGLKINISGSSNLWEKFSANLSLDPDNFKGEGQVNLEQFRAGILTDYYYPDTAWHPGETGINMSVRFKTEGMEILQAELQSTLPQIVLEHDSQEIVIRGKSLKGTLQKDGDQTKVYLTELNLDYPGLNITGELLMDKKPELINVSLKGREVDVASARKTALAIAGDNVLIKKIFQIVKDGSIPLITFNSQGNSFADLGKMENIVIEGSISEGKIFIPGVRLNLDAASGNVVISDGILEGKNLEAELEDSHGREGSLKVGLAGKDVLFHLDVMLQTDMAQLHPLLKRVIKNKAFVEELSLIDDPEGKVSGRLVLGESLKDVKARVEVSDVNLTAVYKRTPFLLEINASHFNYDQSGITVKNLKAKAGKSDYSDIDLRINFQDKPFLEISSGKALIFMDETYPWFSKLVDLPLKSVIRTPFPASHIRLVWDRGGKTLMGGLSLQDGPNVSFDIHYEPKELKISNLTIRDKESDAAFSAYLKKNEVALAFAGKLTGTTVDNILSENKILNGWVKGDIEAHVLKDQPAHSTARGRLEGKDIVFLLKQNEPVNIKSISLDAEKSNIKVVSADMAAGENHLKLNGDIHASGDEFVFDMKAVTSGIEWENLKKIIESEKDVRDKKLFYDFPIKGTVRVNSEYFTYEQFTFKPFHANIAVDSANINIADIESGICGISSPGSIELMPQETSLNLQPSAENQELEHVMDCLFNVKKQTTGKYDLKANFTGRGKSKELLESLSGDMEFHARDGRIYKGGVLAKVLAFLNLTEIFRGRIPDLVKEGFAYKSMTAAVDLNGATLNIKESVIDGASMTLVGKGDINIRDKTMDLEILVAPLKTTDFIIKKIPVVREITGGSLVSLPVKVKGDISNPKITFLSPTAVGSGLLGIMKNTIQAPFKVIEPIIPDKKDE